MAKRGAEAGGAGSSRPKKKQCTTQLSLKSFFKPALDKEGSTSNKEGSSTSQAKIVASPMFYGIHVYSELEISKAVGLQKQFQTFWNEKAHEICADKSLRARLQSKAAIQGSIYTSWYLHKTHLLELQAEDIREEAKKIYQDKVTREFRFSTIDKNLERMLQSYATVIALSENINSLSSISEKKAKEEDLDKEISELKRAQDSLHKTLERRREELSVAKKDIEEQQTLTAGPSVELSDDEMEELIEEVRNEEKNL